MAASIRADFSLAVLDGLLVLAAYVSMLLLRFDGSVPRYQVHRLWVLAGVIVATHLASNWVWRLYGQLWRHASVEEARRILLAGASSVALLSFLLGRRPAHLPRSVVILGGVVATTLMGATRFQSRLFSVHRGNKDTCGLRVAVVGAGHAGGSLVREMLRTSQGALRPVVLLDDDPRKHGRSVIGIPVVGGVELLPFVARDFDIHQVILAIPSAAPNVIARVVGAAERARVPVKVVRRVADLVQGQVSIRDLRDVHIEDLLGRKQVETDLAAVREALAGRRVLITGAGGSIGSEIARQVAALDPAELVLLDHDETHLHDVAQVLSGVSTSQVLADIRDADELASVFRTYRPHVVFHAAAHKHVPLLERHPSQAIRTNVLGTRNVLDCAAQADVDRLVFISTDKAVHPSSVMGASKWLGEQLLLHRAPSGGRFCAVRFGNVLGSRGSVIPTFSRQIASGGPVTVTDPRMTRFFMSIQEAVQLVLQASVLARNGDVFMLDMGEPVNILELAKRMIRLSGQEVGTDIEIRITGTRPGEKLEEELRSPDEGLQVTAHPSVHRIRPVKLGAETLEPAIERLQTLARLRREDDAAELLLHLAHEAATVHSNHAQSMVSGLEQR